MSQPTADGTGLADDERGYRAAALPVSLATLLGAVALVPTAGVLGLRLLRNAPTTLPPVARTATPAATAAAGVVPALAMLGLAIATDRRGERIALAAVGVFAVLGAVDPAAWLPAAAAVLVGTTVALPLELGRLVDPLRADTDLRDALGPALGPAALAALGVLALTWSLVASAGIETTTFRPAGAALAFATLAALPLVRVLDGAVELGLWALAAFAVAVAAASAPFVAGAVVLVAFGAGSVPFVLLALGIGGAVATAVADARRGALGPAVGAALLLAAGVPATLPRAVAFALGLVVLVREWGPIAAGVAPDGTAPSPRGVADA
ncbi:hypothetical protein [Halosimplex amylolyticum]|uniref:hypothetical protein n=1 Tax=Halosimplex amylolyticum TaxID=3396616 RepID=UPI003F563904